jgi:hypothetical protein
MSTRHKLYRDGTFFDLTSDPFEEKPIPVSSLTGANAEAAKKLQAALDLHANVRPAHLMAMPDTSKQKTNAAKKKKA